MSKKNEIWPKQRLEKPEQMDILDRLQALPAEVSLSIVSRFLAERGQERLLRAGYTRDQRQRNLRTEIYALKAKKRGFGGSGYHWEDHGVALRNADGHRAYLCEPYGLNQESMKEMLAVAEEMNLEILFWQVYGSWCPDATTAFLFKEKTA
jgi:hypothetical protein